MQVLCSSFWYYTGMFYEINKKLPISPGFQAHWMGESYCLWISWPRICCLKRVTDIMHGKMALHGHVLRLNHFFDGQYPFQIYPIVITFILMVDYSVTFVLHLNSNTYIVCVCRNTTINFVYHGLLWAGSYVDN